MAIREHLKSAFIGGGIFGALTGVVAAGGWILATTAAAAAFWSSMLIAGCCAWGAALVATRLCGPQEPHDPQHRLSAWLGAGVTAVCLLSLGGSSHEAAQNRNKVLTETKALVRRFERAVSGTPRREPNAPYVTPSQGRKPADEGWIGQAPWQPPAKK